MAILFLVFGLLFYRSKGKASNYITGYNQKSEKEREKINEVELCKIYGVRMMLWAVPFAVGAVIDSFVPGIGCVLAWVVWIGLFVWHMVDRVKREKTKL